ncbi:hypothetical protein LP109_10925 [Moraxella bovis]|uniref:hypothetical protein n=1 Tax=Moraxella bovis TaxID=476 RepID=UPI0009CBCFD1|nr:hypothetical protein [Moraxella bovis]OOR91793.1 hypothetical protein B0182_02315 [Moraxella bovis]UZA16144.1 hypothetical protein LP109_10925 [Moraxella bovis]
MSGFFMGCPRLSFGLYVCQNMGIGTGQNGRFGVLDTNHIASLVRAKNIIPMPVIKAVKTIRFLAYWVIKIQA